MTGMSVERYPEVAREFVARGHEAAAHGRRWSPSYQLTRSEEMAFIAEGSASVERVTGQRPVGWNAHSLRNSANTLEILSGVNVPRPTASMGSRLACFPAPAPSSLSLMILVLPQLLKFEELSKQRTATFFRSVSHTNSHLMLPMSESDSLFWTVSVGLVERRCKRANVLSPGRIATPILERLFDAKKMAQFNLYSSG
jgi:peptidoglycan/xylan/chitin deacetylase (PgdA/CDA1 family)